MLLPTWLSAQNSGKAVSLDLDQVTVGEFFETLRDKSGLDFVYNARQMKSMPKITIHVSKEDVSMVLDKVFDKTSYSWTIKNNIVTIVYAPAHKGARVITGQVLDNSRMPVPGVSVSYKYKGKVGGTATDIDGKYSIKIPADCILTYSFVGMKTFTASTKGKAVIDVVLKEDSHMMDEVVVVAYGRQKKANLTGAVSTVDKKTLQSRPVSSVTKALQGAVPGLNMNVGKGGGEINGSNMNINIRGAGTIGSGSRAAPLVLVDGTPGGLDTVNPSDIESISVLKDAASCAIYGSKAAFGVILVTTKSGKRGNVSVSYNASLRFSTAIQVPRMLDSYRFAQYFNEAAANSGARAIFKEDILKKIKHYQENPNEESLAGGVAWDARKQQWGDNKSSWADTDWFSELYRRNAPEHEHNVSVNGGGTKIKYYFSGNFLDKEGLIRFGKDTYKRYSFSNRTNIKFNNIISMAYSGRWSRSQYSKPNYLNHAFYTKILDSWPTSPLKDPNGFLLPGHQTLQLRDGGIDKTQGDNTRHQLVFTITLLKDWIIHIEGNYNVSDRFRHSHQLPIYGHDPDGKPFVVDYNKRGDAGQTKVQEYASRGNFFNGRFYTDYSKTIGRHYMHGLIGMDMEKSKSRMVDARNSDLITSDVPTLNTSTNPNPMVKGGYSHSATMGFFSRINYSYAEKYLFEASLRRDGSSRFVGDKRWGWFPTMSTGWNISREKFFRPLTDIISHLKLRASWGELGNTNTVSLYPWFENLYTSTSSSQWLLNGKRQNIALAPHIVSSSMTWEKVASWNVGLDWGLLNNRLQGSFEYFTRYTRDMVGPGLEIPSIIGTKLPNVNNTNMKSYGWELEMKWNDSFMNGSYGFTFVLSDDKQKVTKYYNESKSLSNYYQGQHFGEIWGFKTVGIASSDEQMNLHINGVKDDKGNVITPGNKPSWGSQWAAGDIMYADLNGDGKVDTGSNKFSDHGDLKIIGNAMPRFRYGFNAHVRWKGFDASIFLQGVGKRDFFSSSGYSVGANVKIPMMDNPYFDKPVGFKEHWDFWRDEDNPLGANLNAHFPRPLLAKGGKNFVCQTRFLEDASYLRIKNVQVGYSLPSKLLNKLRIKRLRLYVSADNLYTFTKMSKIYDPEGLQGTWHVGQLYPLTKVWSAGVNLNF